MKYIRIRNVANEEMIVPRIALEKLGLSTKRNDAETIGRFGSGIKFAPIAALRNGWEWWFVGRDNYGPYYMQYAIHQEDGIDCVWYDYGDELKPSSFTLGAGELSWTDPFQIIREPIANAMDGAKVYGGDWSIDIVDEIDVAEDNEFCVYITASPELMKVVDNIDAYFSFNREVLSDFSKNKILKAFDKSLRVYCQDVLIHHRDDESMFDYCFDRIDLNEERNVKSEWDMNWNIAYSVIRLDDEDLIKKVIQSAVTSAKYEWNPSVASHYGSSTFTMNWQNIFADMYGDNAVIYPMNTMGGAIDGSLKLRGMKGIGVATDDAYKLLSGSGIKNYTSVLGEEAEYEIDYDIDKYPVLKQAVAFVKAAEQAFGKYEDRVSILCGDAARECRGLTLNKGTDKCMILVSEDHLQSGSLTDIIATLIHEYDHASTGIGDGYSDEGRKFRDLADKRIGKMIVQNYRPNPFFIRDGVVCLPVSEISRIGGNLIAITEHIRMMNCFFMKIGDFVLKLTGTDIEENFGHAHDPHFCDNATVVSYPTMINIENMEIVLS